MIRRRPRRMTEHQSLRGVLWPRSVRSPTRTLPVWICRSMRVEGLVPILAFPEERRQRLLPWSQLDAKRRASGIGQGGETGRC